MEERMLPRYKSHKEVHALKIKQIESHMDGSATITPIEAGYDSFIVPSEYVNKHCPHAGGYYVVYKDGYESFSPAVAFESGYTLIA